jgi:hypothetical protein
MRSDRTRAKLALDRDIPIRFLDRWNGEGRLVEQCNLFFGLPTPGVKAWVEVSAPIDARKKLISATKPVAPMKRNGK